MATDEFQHEMDHLRTTSFDLLVRAVEELVTRGKRPTAAGVRSEMNHLSAGGFSLETVGFARFRDLLDEAEAAGRVVIARPAAGVGSDAVVTLPGSPSTTAVLSGPRVEPLPRAVWRAFVSWESGATRAADRRTGEIWVFPQDAVAFEPASVTALREKVTADPERYYPIRPADMAEQLSWAQAYVREGTLSSEARSVLQSALDGNLPLRAFTAAIRGLELENQEWRAFRVTKVREYIDAWSRSSGVPLSLLVSAASASAPAARPTARRADPVRSEEAHRDRLLRAIGTLTLEELLELRLPARLLLHLDER